jgi:hypothetical protein
MAPDAIGAGTIKRLSELLTGGVRRSACISTSRRNRSRHQLRAMRS